jgi:hypothetical protein
MPPQNYRQDILLISKVGGRQFRNKGDSLKDL